MKKQEQLWKELEKQRDEITRQRNEIIESIQYASLIQTSLLPQKKLIDKVFPRNFVLYVPKNIVSGDFYWLVTKENKAYFAVADCTGHGVPGALMSILGISFLNEIVTVRENLPANRILNLLREMVMKALHQTGDSTEAMDGMDIALCIYDKGKNVLQYAGANNPLYIVRQDVVIEYKPDRMPIGVSGVEEQPFINHYIALKKNDNLYLFSDGYVDQFGGSEGKKFKSDPFRTLLLKMQSVPMKAQKKILLDSFEEWKGQYIQVDDILVMGIKIP
ncbi:MAG: SpoIIE family protein phosphatase [Nitrospiraceae bacterium]|nr:SpoIIE family protein phosphatase [Nitrospiraceae bacterium]